MPFLYRKKVDEGSHFPKGRYQTLSNKNKLEAKRKKENKLSPFDEAKDISPAVVLPR